MLPLSVSGASRTPARPTRRARSLGLAALAALVTAAAPGVAEAAPYTITQCKDPVTAQPVGSGMPDGWNATPANGPTDRYVQAYAECGTGGGGFGLRPVHATGLWTGSDLESPAMLLMFEPAPNTTMVGFELHRALKVPAVNTTNYWVRSGTDGHCYPYSRSDCARGDFGAPLSANNKVTGTSAPWAMIGCAGADKGCPRDRTSIDWAIYSARITLDDSQSPQLHGVDGDFLAGGEIAGTRKLELDASDTGGGLHKLIVTSSASSDYRFERVLDNGNGHCAAATWSRRVPCPLSVGEIVAVDTTKMPEGPQTLTITVRDVAGNERSTTRSVMVDNVVLPTDPRGDFDRDGLPNDTDPDDDNDRVADGADPAPFDVTIPGVSPSAPGPAGSVGPTGGVGPAGGAGAPGAAGADALAGAHRGALNGLNASPEARLQAVFAHTTQRTMKVRYGRRAPIVGTLRDPSGRPIVGAELSVLARSLVRGAQFAPVDTTVTDAQGRFLFVAPVSGSRVYRFAYRVHMKDVTFAQTSEVEVRVTPSVRFTPGAKVVRNKQVVRFSGHVLGAPTTARKVVEIQVRQGSRWRTIQTTRLRAGRFAWSYRFQRTVRTTTYQFRALVRSEPAWPFESGASPVQRVKVRG